MNWLTRPLTWSFVPAAAIVAVTAAAQPAPPDAPPLVEKTFQRREVGGDEEFTVHVRATEKVPPALLEMLERTLEVRRIGRRDRRAELGFWLDRPMAPDAERAELMVELVPLSPQVDPRQFVWTWPDLFQMSRPGVLELRPHGGGERMAPRPDAPAEDDVGVVVQPLHGGTHTVTGRLTCNGVGAPYLQVAVGGFGGTSATDGTFTIAGEFSGVPGSVFVGYTGNVRLNPASATPTAPLQIMDDWHVTRSDRVDQSPTTTGSVSAFGNIAISTTDCVLWARGVRALTHYFGLMGAAPPAGQLQIKRWTSIDFSATAPHTPYAYLVLPSDASSPLAAATFFHEFGHSVRHVADGPHTHWDYDNFRFAYARPHDGGQVTNRGFVFNEGWATYWEAVVTSGTVAVLPGIAALDPSFIDFNEARVAERLLALSAPVGHAFMVKLLLDNPGAIHTLEQFERLYCAAPGPSRPAFCSGTAPTRSFAPCPTGYSNDGTTCRLIQVIGKPSFGRGAGLRPGQLRPGPWVRRRPLLRALPRRLQGCRHLLLAELPGGLPRRRRRLPARRLGLRLQQPGLPLVRQVRSHARQGLLDLPGRLLQRRLRLPAQRAHLREGHGRPRCRHDPERLPRGSFPGIGPLLPTVPGRVHGHRLRLLGQLSRPVRRSRRDVLPRSQPVLERPGHPAVGTASARVRRRRRTTSRTRCPAASSARPSSTSRATARGRAPRPPEARRLPPRTAGRR